MKWFPLLLAVAATAPYLAAEDVRDLVPGYDKYQPDSRFSVNAGALKARRVNEHATLVVIETGGPAKVKFSAPGITPLRFIDIRRRQRMTRKTSTLDLATPKDGIAWLVIFDPPPEVSVYDYQPRSPLKAPNTGPMKARYPVVDVHAHLSTRRATLEERLEIMDAANVALVIDSPMAFAGEETASSYRKFESRRPDRFLTFATIDFTRRREPGFAQEAIRRLERDIEEFGVVGIGETHDKGSGIFGFALVAEAEPPVYVDDPRLMAVWKAAARLKLPILFHIADPPLWYEPADRSNEHLLRIRNSPWFHVAGTATLSVEEVLERRNKVMEQVPDLQVIGAHMASSTEDLATLAATLRKFPNLYPEVGVRHTVLARQPRVAREFFIEFQDRVLYGADGIQPLSAYRNQWRIFETADDSFAAPGRRADPFYLYGLDLPDVVLKKLYYANAAKLMPKVKQRLLKLHPELDFPE
ncbi:MAG: amidohydrolase family protein [bacterium]|nr:amidohydrolase family protein [bacterium]